MLSRQSRSSSAGVSTAPSRATTKATTSSPHSGCGRPTTEHSATAHRRLQVQDVLDLARIDVRAAGNDHVLGAVLQRQETVLVEGADVAGPQPAIAQSPGRGLRILPVARHHRVALDDDLADL